MPYTYTLHTCIRTFLCQFILILTIHFSYLQLSVLGWKQLKTLYVAYFSILLSFVFFFYFSLFTYYQEFDVNRTSNDSMILLPMGVIKFGLKSQIDSMDGKCLKRCLSNHNFRFLIGNYSALKIKNLNLIKICFPYTLQPDKCCGKSYKQYHVNIKTKCKQNRVKNFCL